jgi:uracil-DNA glycosylase family 4
VQYENGSRNLLTLVDFWRSALKCQECIGLAPWRKFPPEVRGNPHYGLMILGEAPGRVSLDNRRPFSNPRNLMIRQAFASAVAPVQIEPEQILYFSDAVKCWPASASGANRSPSAGETRTCLQRHLRRELEIIKPRTIFAFGVRAASAVLDSPVKLAAVHGTVVERADGYRVIPLMHPSTINIAGMRRVGIRDLADYEVRLASMFRREIERLGIDCLSRMHRSHRVKDSGSGEILRSADFAQNDLAARQRHDAE